MNNTLTLLLATALLVGASSAAQAYDSYNETYQIMGCRSYLEGKDQNRGWLIGYLTTLENQRGTNTLQGKNLQQVYNLFDRYCRANPRRNMDEAANAVFMALQRQ